MTERKSAPLKGVQTFDQEFILKLLEGLIFRLRQLLPSSTPVEQVAFYCGAVSDRASMRPATPDDSYVEAFSDLYDLDELRKIAGQQLPEAATALQTPVPEGCFRVLFHLGRRFVVADFDAIDRGSR
jgi:hypothetical protein